MIWIASLVLIASYLLLGRKRFCFGWAFGVAGNFLYIVITLRMHRLDLAFLPTVFTLLAGYNLFRFVREKPPRV